MSVERKPRFTALALAGAGIATLRPLKLSLGIAVPFTALLTAGEIVQHFWPDIDLSHMSVWALGAEIFLAGYWQRLLLLGPERSTARGPYAPRYLAFGLHALLAGFVIVSPAMLVGLLTAAVNGEQEVDLTTFFIGASVTIAVLLVLLSRTLLVFPALAIGRRMGIAAAWRLGRGQGIRLGVALVVLAILPTMGVILLTAAADSAQMLESDAAVVASALASRFVEIVTVLAAAGCVAVLYRHLAGDEAVMPTDR